MHQTPLCDVDQFIDGQPLGRYQLLIVALCATVLAIDGFDAQAIGFAAPALVGPLHIARSSLGPVFSSGLFGMMIGALVFGPLADRFGRKPILVFCTALLGLCSLLTAKADSLESLMGIRLATGLGLGGAMPNAVALTSEYMPKRLRATSVMIMFCGFSLGAAAGGFVAAALIDRYGWQSIFLAGGVLPCVTAVVLSARLPESIRFLLINGGDRKRVVEYLSKIAPGVRLSPDTPFAIEQHGAGGFAVKQLFAAGRSRMTLLLWVIFFMSLLDVYFLNNWLPTMMHDAGIAVEKAILIAAMFQVGGTAGALTLGRVVDRQSSYRVLAWAYFAASACVFLIGASGASTAGLVCTVFAAGFFVIGAQAGANALAAEFYPTAIRSTGVGWALGIGRIGSIIGPALGGALLSARGGTTHVFWAAAVPVFVAAVAGFLAARGEERQPIRPALASHQL